MDTIELRAAAAKLYGLARHFARYLEDVPAKSMRAEMSRGVWQS